MYGEITLKFLYKHICNVFSVIINTRSDNYGENWAQTAKNYHRSSKQLNLSTFHGWFEKNIES